MLNAPALATLLAFARELQGASTFEEVLGAARVEIERVLGTQALPVALVVAVANRELTVGEAARGASVRVPLRWGERENGALHVGTPCDADLDYLQALASQLAAAVERIRTQWEQRRASEVRFRRLWNAGILGIAISEPSGAITDANETFLDLVGYSREDLHAGRITNDRLNEPAQQRLDAAAMDDLAHAGVTQPWDKHLLRKDGSRVRVLVGAATLDASTGERLAFVLDLTERQRAEAAIRASVARESAVLEAALDAIMVMDHEGRVKEFNPAAERTFGYSREEAVGALLADLIIPPALRASHAEGLARYLRTGKGRVLGRRIEVPAMRKDGTTFPAEVAIVRIVSEGAPLFTGYLRDITERQRAAEAESLRREKDASQAANKELETFSYSVAHDLRAPLRGISGFTGAFLEDHGDELDPKGRAQLERVSASAVRMGHIIDALLSLARLSRTELSPQPVNLSEMANAIVDNLRASAPERDVDVKIAEGVVAQGDPHLLRAVLENLLGNAWKFTKGRPDSRIEFGARAGSEEPTYFVRDNGAGFKMEYVDRLFTPFQRLHSADAFEGTGLGLATVARIIRRHGGHITAEGAENAGATITFTLPQESKGGVPWIGTK